MSFLDSMNISASALTATRLRMDVINENMANVSTTRSENGEPYRRKYVIFQEITGDNSDSRSRRGGIRSRFRGIDDDGGFSTVFNRAGKNTPGGVRVIGVGRDQSEFKYDYDPNHPDADEDGFVRMPNVEVVQEMVDMMAAYRAYEANITAVNVFKDMAMKTLEIGK